MLLKHLLKIIPYEVFSALGWHWALGSGRYLSVAAKKILKEISFINYQQVEN